MVTTEKDNNSGIQQELLQSEKVVMVSTRLECRGSPKQPYYVVDVIRLSGSGYMIRKTSGYGSAKAHVEMWFRWNFAAAMEKLDKLVRAKTKAGRDRTYEIVSTGKGY